jgi:hypothetical protein
LSFGSRDYTDLLEAQLVKGRFALLGSKALDKSLYKSVSIFLVPKDKYYRGALLVV